MIIHREEEKSRLSLVKRKTAKAATEYETANADAFVIVSEIDARYEVHE